MISLPDVASTTATQRSYNIKVQTDTSATNVALAFVGGTGTTALNAGSPTINGANKVWDFTWSNVAAGSCTFTFTVTTPSGTATASRDTTVVYRQVVTPVAGKLDNDDDGIPVDVETTAVPLPTTAAETWTNDDVHRYIISAKTSALSSDTDGDGTTNAAEDAAGTNPFDATSNLHVQSLLRSPTTGSVQITWTSVLGKNYQVEFTSDLVSGSYAAVSSVITATRSVNSFTVQPSASSGFYRVKIVQ